MRIDYQAKDISLRLILSVCIDQTLHLLGLFISGSERHEVSIRMFGFHMILHAALDPESFRTYQAFERFLAGVHSVVHLKI